jgi:hypothetical protein
MRFFPVVFTLIPVPALAHSGDHTPNTVIQNLYHLVTAPDHLIMAAGALALIVAVIYLRKRQA